MKIKCAIIACIVLATPGLSGQNPVLEEYIREGLRSNQGLKQQQLEYTRELMALKEARGLFFPGVSLHARYTLADGGRVIEFPVGDLLNPVYSTLNMLTASDLFPQIENESFSFYRPKEHETKLSLIQPIFDHSIIQNVNIKREAAELSRIGVDQYKKELILEITRAYYNFQRAHSLSRLADSTLLLVNEHVRVSRRLFENDMVTLEAVYRSEAEQARIESERARARILLESSKAYFNFLLNRSLGEEISLTEQVPKLQAVSLDGAQESALKEREELNQIKRYQEMNRQLTRLHRGSNIPGIYGLIDYGFQGEEYRFTSEDDFVLASLVLKWDLFQGLSNRAKVQQSLVDGRRLEEALTEAELHIRLDVINRYYAYLSSYESLEAAKKQKRSASRAFRLIDKKYAEGQASLLELIDARTSMTGASSEVIIASNEYFISLAELEHAMGNTDLNRY